MARHFGGLGEWCTATTVALAAIFSAEALGWLAGFISFSLRVPQLQKARSAPDIAGISVNTWIVALVTNLLWLAYGILQHDPRITLSTAIMAPTSLAIILAVKRRHSKDPNQPATEAIA